MDIQGTLKQAISQYIAMYLPKGENINAQVDAYVASMAELITEMTTAAQANQLEPQSWNFLRDMAVARAARVSLGVISRLQEGVAGVVHGVVSTLVASLTAANPLAGIVVGAAVAGVTQVIKNNQSSIGNFPLGDNELSLTVKDE